MDTVRHRYSAEIQRTRGLLELAAGLYDTSLSFQTTRAAEQAVQTESRVGYSLTLVLTAPHRLRPWGWPRSSANRLS